MLHPIGVKQENVCVHYTESALFGVLVVMETSKGGKNCNICQRDLKMKAKGKPKTKGGNLCSGTRTVACCGAGLHSDTFKADKTEPLRVLGDLSVFGWLPE